MFNFVVEDNVPEPFKKGEVINFVRGLKVGQSFVINEEEWKRIKNAQTWLANKDGIVITIRTLNKADGVHRVWRLK